jgi:hypothetical protein
VSRSPAGPLANATGAAIGTVLGAIAALRRGKAVHPKGEVFEGRLKVSGSSAAPAHARLLSTPAEHRVIVRLSRSLGLPSPLPDLFGIAIRVPDAYGPGRHQDLLLVTSADFPIVHHVFLPARGPHGRPYTSSLPYRSGDETFIVGALPRGAKWFDIAVASPMGRFRPVAELRLGQRLPAELDALRFNPWNTGGGMDPVGVLNGARDVAYTLSQASWGRAQANGRELQAAADKRVAEL